MIPSNRGSNLTRFLILISLATAVLFAQGAGRGSVQGTVKDATGGIIRGATVTLNSDSGTVQTVTSGADGTYVFRNVAAGTYTVSSFTKGLQQALTPALSASRPAKLPPQISPSSQRSRRKSST